MSTGIRVLTSDINEDESEPSSCSLLRVPPEELPRAEPTRSSPWPSSGCSRLAGDRRKWESSVAYNVHCAGPSPTCLARAVNS